MCAGFYVVFITCAKKMIHVLSCLKRKRYVTNGIHCCVVRLTRVLFLPFLFPCCKLTFLASKFVLVLEWNRVVHDLDPFLHLLRGPYINMKKKGGRVEDFCSITENDKELNPSPMDLRMQAHRLIWDALDYIGSVEADAFFPGFNNDGSRYWTEVVRETESFFSNIST
ncbi:hypothetical protein GQ457_10G014270 [Hibiscus cannabinus]